MRYSGIVRRGARRGSALGFPTINIALDGASISGVYAARVSMNGEEYEAAAFADPAHGFVEAYLIGFDGDAYGRFVAIDLREKLRESKTFGTVEELKAAIAADIAKAREYFHN